MLNLNIHSEADRKNAIWHLGILDLKLGPYVFSLGKYEMKRRNQANNLYWKWLEIIGEDTGYSKDDMHVIMACKFLGFREIEYNGHLYNVPKSTQSLTTKEFSSYMDNIQQIASSLGIQLPLPEFHGMEGM